MVSRSFKYRTSVFFLGKLARRKNRLERTVWSFHEQFLRRTVFYFEVDRRCSSNRSCMFEHRVRRCAVRPNVRARRSTKRSRDRRSAISSLRRRKLVWISCSDRTNTRESRTGEGDLIRQNSSSGLPGSRISGKRSPCWPRFVAHGFIGSSYRTGSIYSILERFSRRHDNGSFTKGERNESWRFFGMSTVIGIFILEEFKRGFYCRSFRMVCFDWRQFLIEIL